MVLGNDRRRGYAASSSAKQAPHSGVKPTKNTQLKESQENMKAAVVAAFQSSSSAAQASSSSSGAFDAYGKGSPSDRLQFGYSPAIAEEAVTYHQRFSSGDWVAERRRLGRLTIAKHQRNPAPHCELLIPALKLREHWKNQVNLKTANTRQPPRAAGDLEALLNMFASKQRT